MPSLSKVELIFSLSLHTVTFSSISVPVPFERPLEPKDPGKKIFKQRGINVELVLGDVYRYSEANSA